MRRPTASPSQNPESVIMEIEGSDRVEFRDVEALSYRRRSLVCRVGSMLVSVPPDRILPGSQVRRRGDRGKLVLTEAVAIEWHGTKPVRHMTIPVLGVRSRGRQATTAHDGDDRINPWRVERHRAPSAEAIRQDDD